MKKVLAAVVALGGLSWLGKSVDVALQFLFFLLAFVLPSIFFIQRWLVRLPVQSAIRWFLSLWLFVVLLVPVYLVRKLFGEFQWMFDVFLSGTLIAASVRKRAVIVSELSRIDPRTLWGMALLVLLFGVSWLGFEDLNDRSVWYYGLFGVDFGNLANVVTLIRVSPFLPLGEVAGVDSLNYHWFYFVLPALFSDFLGWEIRSAYSLVLCNWLVATFFLSLLTAIAARLVDGVRVRSSFMHLASVIVIFAASGHYIFLAVARFIGVDWPSGLSRNYLVLTPLNSMLNFSNNTMAVGLAVLMPVLIGIWNDSRDRRALVLGVSVWLTIFVLSATLFFSVSLALGVWLVFGKVREAAKVMLLTVPLLLAFATLLFLMGIVGSDDRAISVQFDHGQFVATLAVVYFPIIAFGVYGMWRGRRLDFGAVLVLAAIAVPTMLFVSDSPTGSVDFSMKNGTLFAVAMTPFVGLGVTDIWSRAGRSGVKGVWILLIAAGVLNSAAYLSQFGLYKWSVVAKRGQSVPIGYYEALDFIRRNSNDDDLLIDLAGIEFPRINIGLLISERRGWLPISGRHYPNSIRELLTARLVAASEGTMEDFTIREIGHRVSYLVVRKDRLHTVVSVPAAFESGVFRIYRIEHNEG